MANPDVLDAVTVTHEILVDAQLASGNNNFTVPSGQAWAVKSFVLCNTSGSAVDVDVLVIKTGGTARTIVSDYSLVADETLIFDAALVAMLPEAAVLRINSSAATSVDVLVTGVATA